MDPETKTPAPEPAFANLDDDTLAILLDDKIATGG